MVETAYQSLRIGDIAPNFSAQTTEGKIEFYDWLDESWAILFSHPKDFTPVCTTELAEAARLKPEFDQRGVKIIGLSVSLLEQHHQWITEINKTQNVELNFPIIADEKCIVAHLYGMIHAKSNDTMTVRTVFVIDPQKKIRLILAYPASTGRNFKEILRVVDSLQLTDQHLVATPANWKWGDDCIILPSIKDPQQIKDLFPAGYREVTPYLRFTKQPNLK